MVADKGKIAKNAIALYFRMGIMLVVSLYTARVVLQQLGASDYGIQNVVGGIITMLTFMNGALSQGVQRFFNFYKARGEEDSINKTFWSALIIMSLIGLIITFIGETVGLWFLNNKMNIDSNRMTAANFVYQFSILSMLFSMLMVPFNAMIVSHEDFGIYAYVSIGVSLCNLGISFLLQIAPFDKLIFYSAMMCVLQVGTVITYVIICRRRYINVKPKRHNDKNIYQSLISFSGWNTLGVLSYVISTQGVNILLNIFFGTIVNAARGIAFQISTKVDEFMNNIQQAMNPQIVQLYSRGELKAVQSLIDDNFRWNFALYWLLALPILFEIDYILSLWLGEVPEYTSIFARIVLLRSFLKCFERPINSLNFAIGKMKKINIFASFGVLSSVVLMFILFLFGFPPYWAFIIDVICIFFCTLYYMGIARSNNVFSFRHFVNKIVLPIATVIIVTFTAMCLLRKIPIVGFTRLLITLLASLILTGLTLYIFLLSNTQKDKVLAVIRKIFKV